MNSRPPYRPRLAVVLSHPTQYYSPWFRWMAATAPFDLRVFYLWNFGVAPQRDPLFGARFAWDVDLLTGYEHEFVPNRAREPGTETFGGLDNPDLPARLRAWHPDAALVFGYRFRTHLRLIRWARRQRLPLIFRGDSHLLGHSRPSWTKRLVLRWIYRHFAAVTYVGAANRDYFRAFGVPDARLHFAPHAVNHVHFDPTTHRHRDRALALRHELGLAPATRVVLFAGKFLPAKQPRALLTAFARLRPPDTALVFVGDGEERAALERDAAASGAAVHFLPFANQSEMPSRYLLADLFVLPSRGLYETWGLAVNEAMQMGVPCLVSDLVGCQRDLVTDGRTGWVFCAQNPDTLQAKLAEARQALAQPAARDEIRRAVAERISGYTYAHATTGLLAALRTAADK